MKKQTHKIGIQELCELSGMTRRVLRRRMEEGVFPPPIDGLYDFRAVMEGLLKYEAAKVERRTGSDAVEQARLLKAKREKKEAELDNLRRQYVKAADVGPLLRRLAYHQREALTRILCDELPPKLVGLDPIAARRVMAEHGTDRVCDLFSANIRLWLDVPTPDEA